MKRFLLFFYTLIVSLSVCGQELEVKSFIEKTNDLSASTNVRLDNNDIPCALVKVHLAAQNASFEGNVVGNVTYKTSEYWVYMSKGSKRLTVSLEGVLPLSVDFGDFGVKALESKITYVLTLALPPNYNNGQQQEVRTKTGWIIIDSDPKGASVYINDEFVGNTPLESYKQPYGTYQYRVEKLNYHSTSGTVELNSAQFEKTVKLLPAFGSISVAGGVAGATVLLDGRSTGKQSPCTLTEVPSGAHVVTLQKDKYAPQQFNVTVEDGKEAKVSANLNARFAAITIKTLQGADILIDNATKGSTSCTIDLMEGYHDVEVRLAHHKKATKQIQVVAGQAQTIDLKPTPIYGSLDVTSTPRNATITIDGKPVGQTPFTVEQLLEGEHTVTLSLDGYASETNTVSIAEGQTASVSATLKSGREITITSQEAGAHIYIDGKDMGLSPYKGNLTFGQHTAYTMLNGKKSSERTISVPEGNGALPTVTLSFLSNQTFTVKGVSFTMMAVEGGTFTMGTTSEQGSDAFEIEKPIHKVTLSDYYIGQTEVTQALWIAVMGSNPSSFKGSRKPVEKVSWSDCQTFISKLNSLTGKRFRLPTEAEWEFACRGGVKSMGYKFSGSNTPDNVAWYDSNSGDTTHDVATKDPNELGIYDMSGNVSEWCSDWYDYYNSNAQTNPTGPSSGSGRVHRGGSCYASIWGCRAPQRYGRSPDYRSDGIGLRLVLSE